MRYQTILFDLDGTLTDPYEGISRSVVHALAAFGIREENEERLKALIGPPLRDSFSQTYGLSGEDAAKAVAVYREYFGTKGLYQNRLYSAVLPMLERLREAGLTLALATSKPEYFARKITAHFGLDTYLHFAGGSEMDGGRSRKAEVIDYVRNALGSPEPGSILMVGDRRHDLQGAAENGIDAAGVLWGYGSRGELAECRSVFLAESPQELADFILG